MRICIEKGFHRKTSEVSSIAWMNHVYRGETDLTLQAIRQANPIAAEVNSRIFWSIYTLDRLVSITLGRPMVSHVNVSDVYLLNL